MPLSVYRGREIVSRTSYTRDEHGRVTEARTTREPEWLDSDRWLAVGLELHERQACPGCGEPRDRAWHPDMEGWYEQRQRQCYACTARDGRNVFYGQITDTRPPGRELHPLPDT